MHSLLGQDVCVTIILGPLRCAIRGRTHITDAQCCNCCPFFRTNQTQRAGSRSCCRADPYCP
eukprot:11198266-Lingulodinium_polyedra.AAC.1